MDDLFINIALTGKENLPLISKTVMIIKNNEWFYFISALLDIPSQAEQFQGFPAEHESCRNPEFVLLKITLPFPRPAEIDVTGEKLEQGDIFYLAVQNTR